MKNLVKAVYSLIPFKKQLFSFVKLFWRPSERIFKHLYFKGVIKVEADKGKFFKMHHYGFQIENELFWEGLGGGWEKISFELWVKLSKNAKTVMDIGANTGVFAMIAGAMNKNAKLYAFEPVKRVHDKLQKNSDLNNFGVKCEEVAASNFNGTATIYDQDAEHTLSVTVNQNLSDSDVKIIPTEIQTIRMDTYIEQHNIDHIDLMKIDVETHEAEVLEGFGVYLEKFKPTILIEILNDEVGANVQKILDGKGYIYFNIDERKGLRKVDTITKSDFFNYLVCSPEVAKELDIA